jgi:hypothetical protein
MKSFKQHLSESILPNQEEVNVSQIIMAWYPGKSNATNRTQIYESAVVIRALGGTPSVSTIRSAMSNTEFNDIAKGFYVQFFDKYKGDRNAFAALAVWVDFLGKPIEKVKGITDFIHASINKYYSSVPSTFEVGDFAKENTTDCVLIANGSADDLWNALSDLKLKDEATQIKRIRPFGKLGGVTIIDSSKKGLVSFYQVSLKNEGQVGKAGTFVNQYWLGGGKFSSPGEAQATLQRSEHIPDFDELLKEGLIDWAKGKAAKVVASVQAFVSWTSNKLGSIVSKITNTAERFANKKLKKSKGIKAIENIFSEMGQSLTEEFLTEATGPVKLTPGQVENFRIVYQDFLGSGGSNVNEVHNFNMSTVKILNRSFAQENRDMEPITVIGDGRLDINQWAEDLKYLGTITYKDKIYIDNKGKKITTVTRAQVNPMYKIASNYSANVVIEGLLRTATDSLGTYKTIGKALFAMTGNLEAEVKFGNTKLPLLICYGGKTQKLAVMGKRDDYSTALTDKLVNDSKGIDTDYPILSLRYNKKEGYNVVNMKLLNSFVSSGDTVKPTWMQYGIRTNSGSSFTCTVEASRPTDTWT